MQLAGKSKWRITGKIVDVLLKMCLYSRNIIFEEIIFKKSVTSVNTLVCHLGFIIQFLR